MELGDCESRDQNDGSGGSEGARGDSQRQQQQSVPQQPQHGHPTTETGSAMQSCAPATRNWSKSLDDTAVINGVKFDKLVTCTMREMGGHSHRAGEIRLTSNNKIRVGYFLTINGHRDYYRVVGKGSAIIEPPLEKDLDDIEPIARYRAKLLEPPEPFTQFRARIIQLAKDERVEVFA